MKRAAFVWRMFFLYPRIMRLAWRVWLWNANSGGSIEERLRRTPGGLDEFNAIARAVLADFQPVEVEKILNEGEVDGDE